jgi:superoxide dismutase, Cu-Zn family
VTLTLEIRGATPGEKGVHLHEHGDCSAPDASSAGDHWNPTNEDHGKLGETSAAHAGDIGNLTVGEDGTGRLEFTTDRWSIGRDPQTDILGRTIVVHANRDDLRSQPSGDSGARIGCGVISES